MHQMTTLCALAAALSFHGSAFATEPAPAAAKPKLKGTMKASTPKIDLGLPVFEGAPKDTNLQKVTDKPAADLPTASSDSAYTIVSVVNTKSFVHSGQGIKPGPALTSVMARGSPLMTEKFSSVFKVRGVGKRGAVIEVKIVDAKSDTVMEAQGQLVFRGDELDWTVEWAPAFVRAPGTLQMNIRIGSQPVVSFPITIEAKKQ